MKKKRAVKAAQAEDRMQIIIVGAGKMGFALADSLINEGHNVTVIDNSEAVIDRGDNTMDALFIRGNGVRADVLKEANIESTDVVIAATGSDEMNMLVCLTAKKLGAQYTVARIRDPEYLESIHFLQKELLMDYVINPERSTARQKAAIQSVRVRFDTLAVRASSLMYSQSYTRGRSNSQRRTRFKAKAASCWASATEMAWLKK